MGRRVAVVTGRMASGMVREVASRYGVGVYVAGVDVASLIPLHEIEAIACRAAGEGYEVLVVPGMHPVSRRQLEELSSRCGITVVKGPKTLEGLPEVLRLLVEGGVSPSPGDVVDVEPDPARLLEEAAAGFYREGFWRLCCGLLLPRRPPPVLVAVEVYAVPGAEEEAVAKAERFARWGAPVLVIGAGYGYPRRRLLDLLDKVLDLGVCVGVDTPDTRLHAEALEKGASILLSATPETIEDFPRPSRDGVALVLVPFKPGSQPPPPNERARVLEWMERKALEKGYIPVADPVVQPPLAGLGESVVAFYEASRRLRAPLLAGIGNIYELQDADTPGSIALSTALFAELGASVLLVSEESRKARGAVVEALVAAIQASIALARQSLPKDLGVDLLVVKEKREKSWKPFTPEQLANAEWVEASRAARKLKASRDPHGDVIVYLDGDRILAVHVRDGKPVRVVHGTDGEEVYKALIALGVPTRLEHAAYLGYELHRAHMALRLGKSYIQEQEPIQPLHERYNTLIRRYLHHLKQPRSQ